MYCICCKKNNVKPNDGFSSKEEKEEDLLWLDDGKRTVDNLMTDNGVIQIISAGYGSDFDTDKFIIAICDDCIRENLEDSNLLYFGNYMYPKEGFVNEEIEKSKIKWRRKKNLDDLV